MPAVYHVARVGDIYPDVLAAVKGKCDASGAGVAHRYLAVLLVVYLVEDPALVGEIGLVIPVLFYARKVRALLQEGRACVPVYYKVQGGRAYLVPELPVALLVRVGAVRRVGRGGDVLPVYGGHCACAVESLVRAAPRSYRSAPPLVLVIICGAAVRRGYGLVILGHAPVVELVTYGVDEYLFAAGVL